MAQVVIDCVRANSGLIYWNGSTYEAESGSSILEMYGLWDEFGNLKVEEERCFYQFNTSDANTGIPADNTITKVELLYNPSGMATSNTSFNFDWWVYAGDIIGGSLDGTAGEWNGGSLVQFGFFPSGLPSSSFWIDLEDIGSLLNRSGVTDFKLEDHSTPLSNPTGGAEYFQPLWNGLVVGRRGQLRITYEPPATPPPASNVATIWTPHAGI